MGEATYYLKGYKCNEATFDKIVEFFKEGAEAQDWWQEHRGYEHAGKRDEFWKEFESKFPQTSKFLKTYSLFGGDCNNSLAGAIDFGFVDEIEENADLERNIFKYSALVWHFSDWDYIAKYLSDKFGLVKVRWISDEDMNPFDLL